MNVSGSVQVSFEKLSLKIYPLKASNTIPFLTESMQTEENNDNNELKDSLEALENERITHNKLEHVIVSLKQIKILITIAYENTKDDYHVLQNLLKVIILHITNSYSHRKEN